MSRRCRFARLAGGSLCIIYIGALSGCAARPPETIATPVAVSVPVPEPVYCSAPKLEKPALPLARLQPGSPPADTIRAYAATVALLKGAVAERDMILAGCARPAAAAAGKEPR